MTISLIPCLIFELFSRFFPFSVHKIGFFSSHIGKKFPPAVWDEDEWNLKMEHRKWMQKRWVANEKGGRERVTGGEKVEFIFIFRSFFSASHLGFFLQRPKKMGGTNRLDVVRCKKITMESGLEWNYDAFWPILAAFFLSRVMKTLTKRGWEVRGCGGCAVFRARCLQARRLKRDKE